MTPAAEKTQENPTAAPAARETSVTTEHAAADADGDADKRTAPRKIAAAEQRADGNRHRHLPLGTDPFGNGGRHRRLEHVETAGVRLGGYDIALPVPCHGHKRVIVRLFIPEHRRDRLIDHAGDAPLRLRFAVLRQKRQQLPIEKNEREKQQCRRAEEYQPSAMTATHRPFQSDSPLL